MQPEIKILIVEHNPDDIELMEYELKRGGIHFIAQSIQTGAGFRRSIEDFIPDIILSDYSLPSFAGSEAFNIRQQIAPDIPFIFVSGSIGEERSVEYIRSGLTDYVMKDKLFTLPFKVERALKEAREKEEKNKTTRDLLASERLLARAQQLAHIGNWEMNFTDNKLMLSVEGARILALSQGQNQLSFEAWLSLIHPEDKERVLQTLQHSMDTLADTGFHYRIMLKDGTTRHIDSESKFEFDAGGKPKGVFGIMMDVTEKVKAEELLWFERKDKEARIKQSEAKYRAFFENSLDGILLTVTDGSILAANPTACEMFGMTEEEMCAVGRFDLVDKSDQRVHDLIHQRQLTGKAQGELTYRRKDGSTFPGEISSVLFTDSNGQQRTSMFIRDITVRKQAEEKLEATSHELQRAHNELNRVMNSSMDVICAVDEKGIFKKVSAASKAVWGYEPEELVGKYLFDFVYQEDNKITAETASQVMKGRMVNHFENRYIRKDGSLVNIEWSARWDEKDQMRYGVARDVTEKKKLQEAFENERIKLIDLFLQAPTSMGILKGPDHVYEMVNPLYLQLIGKKDIIGKTVREAVPEVVEQGFLELLDNVYKTGETFSANEMLIRFNEFGDEKFVDKYINFIYQAYKNIKGEIEGIFFFAVDVTEQVVSRKKIEESERRYRTLFEQNIAGVFQSNVNGLLLNCNNAFAKMLKYDSVSELLTLNAFDLYFSSKDRNDFITSITDHEKLYNYEVILKCKDGSPLYVLENITARKDDITNEIFYDGILIDISERQLAEMQLKESHAKYKAIIDNAMNAFLLSDGAGKILDVNDTACKLLGYTKEELLTLNRADVFEMQSTEYLKAVDERKKMGMASGEVYGITKTGKHVPIAFTTSVFYTAEGEERLSSMGIDITERKRSEEDNAFKVELLNRIGQAAVATDLKGNINFWNKAAEEIYGWTAIEAIGKNIIDLTPALHSKDQAIELMTQLSMGNTWAGEFMVKHKNGSSFPVFVTDSPIYDNKNNLCGVIGISTNITERKKTEEKILKSHERFINVSKATFNAIWDWDIKTKQLYLGDGFNELFGYPVNEDQNFLEWADHIHPEDREGVITKRLNKIIHSDEESWKDNYRYMRADGSVAHVLDRGILLRNESGTYRMIGAMQDVTDINRLEELLKKANDLSRTGTWEVDLINNITYWSPMVKEIHEVSDDYQPDLASSIDFIVEGEEKDILLKNVKDSIKTGKQWQDEIKIRTAKGNEIWLNSTGDAEFINGKCVKIYGSLQDIDERKKSKLAFINSLEEKNIILESIGDAFFAVDKNWVVTYWNNQAEKRLSTAKNEIIGYNLWEKFPARINSFSYKKYYEAVETGEVVHFEDYYQASDQWYEVSVYPTDNGLSVYAKDVTERKHSEIQLNELNENIRRQSTKLAASNEELERFAYVTSHDLQEPLRMVTNFLQLLQKKYNDQLDDTAHKYINFAVDGADRMKILILDLLEFSRISSVVVNHSVVNLNDIITKTRMALKTAIDESKAIIKVDFLPQVCGNTSQLLQLFQNVIGNAIKYKGNKTPLIQIGFIDKEHEWQFCIKDNGIGIDEKYFEKIFIIFQRLHNRKEYDGTGIGLAICKKIVELHGGTIWVQSSKEGSEFYFTILKKQTSVEDKSKILCDDNQ